MPKKIAIYGSTGSIGTQALEVIEANPELFEVGVLTAGRNVDLLIEQCLKFKPKYAVLFDPSGAVKLKDALKGKRIKIRTGEEGLLEAAQEAEYDMMLAAIVGFAGLLPLMRAIERSKEVALANKETLVVAGDLVMAAARKFKSKLIPVDSEHSAIFQCLVGEKKKFISKIILTASGGPFLGKKPNFLSNVKKDHALQHPNWTMGAKITIDSASLMNKGLEMIEAKWLFKLENEQIEVVVHPQSIVHSFVEFIDGSQKAQLGLPDMKLPIQYALAYPARIPNEFPRMALRNFENLTFERPDIKTFRNLAIAQEAMFTGGNAPCIMNAANEVVVQAFLENKIGFLEMSDCIENCLQKMETKQKLSLEDYIETDQKTRTYCRTLIK